MTKLLTAFGSSIAELKLKIWRLSDEIIHQIVDTLLDNCCGTLKSFKFTYSRGNGKFSVSKLRPLFASLESLSLTGFVLDGDNLLSDCKNLVNLKLIVHYNTHDEYDKLLESLHSQLESLCLLYLDVELPGKHLEKLIRNQTQLRDLSFTNPYRRETEIPSALIDSCSEHLKSLRLIGIYIDGARTPQVRTFFGKLESLSLKNCRLNMRFGDDMFSECKQLHSLTYSLNDSFNEISKSHFPGLRNLKLLCAPGYRSHVNSDTHLSEKLLFLKNHLSLQKLTIWEDKLGIISEFIADSMHHLQKIHIKSKNKCTKTCISLSKMERIKKLTLNSHFTSWEEERKDENHSLFLKGLVSIESIQYLELTNVLVDNGVIEAIGRFKNLRELKLVFEKNNSSSQFLQLEPLEALSHLTVLEMLGPWEISESELINLVTKLKKLKSLSLSLVNFAQLDKLYDTIIEAVHSRNRSLILAISIKSDLKESIYVAASNVTIERDISKSTISILDK